MGDKRTRIASPTVHGDSYTEETTTLMARHGGGSDTQCIVIDTTEGGYIWWSAEWVQHPNHEH